MPQVRVDDYNELQSDIAQSSIKMIVKHEYALADRGH